MSEEKHPKDINQATMTLLNHVILKIGKIDERIDDHRAAQLKREIVFEHLCDKLGIDGAERVLWKIKAETLIKTHLSTILQKSKEDKELQELARQINQIFKKTDENT